MSEKAEKTNQTQKSTAHKIELDRLHGVSMTGVLAVPTFTDKTMSIKLQDETLTLIGQDLEIKTLDTESGRLVVSGKINSLKYSTSVAPTSFFKRILK